MCGCDPPTLLKGHALEQPDTGFPVFAFRVHQFFSRGETVYASLEPEDARYVTTAEQQFVPGDRAKTLFPLAFCRECGQEYYTVRTAAAADGGTMVVPRRLSNTTGDEDSDAGFLYLSSDKPWPDELEEILGRVPDEWLEPHGDGERVKASYRQYVPRELSIAADGRLDDTGTTVHWVPAPFRFCLSCGVSHGGRQPRDFGKLMTLGAGGRSSATTILSLAAIRSLRQDESLEQRARKLLSFTDNRQDASLQAGHFNDFVEVGLIRSALFRAAAAAGEEGSHTTSSLSRCSTRSRCRSSCTRSIRLCDSARDRRSIARCATCSATASTATSSAAGGSPHRISSNAGLLEIDYVSLDELCAADDVWAGAHAVLAGATPAERAGAARVLLDLMRRELAIRVDYLSPTWQEALKQRSSQFLVDPWAIDEEEELVHAGCSISEAASASGARVPRQRLRLGTRRFRAVPPPPDHVPVTPSSADARRHRANHHRSPRSSAYALASSSK